MTRAAWLGMPESRCSSFSSALCGDDLVLAVGVCDRYRGSAHHHAGCTVPERAELQALRRFRGLLFDFLAENESTTWVQVCTLAGSSGRTRLELELGNPDDLIGTPLTLTMGLECDN